MTPRLTLCLAASLSLSPGVLSDGVRLERLSTAGTTTERTFAEELTWQLDTIELSLDGAPVDQALPEVTGIARRRLEVTERVTEAESGWPLAIERDFDAVGADTQLTFDGGGEVLEFTTTSASPLEGLTLALTWNEDEDDFERELIDAEATDEFLAELAPLLDLGGFLPAEEVSEDDSWEVDPGALAQLLRPGGGLALTVREYVPGHPQTMPTGAILASSYVALGRAGGELSGEAEATLVSVEDDVATIRVSFEGECTSELSVDYTALLILAGISEEDAELSLLYELEGAFEIAWDLATGGPIAAEGQLEFYLTAELTWSEEAFGLVQEFSGLFEASGQTRIEASAERD